MPGYTDGQQEENGLQPKCFDNHDDTKYTPFIKFLYDEDYVFDETDDLAYVIELHLANEIVRISDLMLNNTLKDMIQYLRHLCIS